MEQDVMSSVDELNLLKSRAKLMGLTFSNNISIETLREKIVSKQAGEPDVKDIEINPLNITSSPTSTKVVTPSLRDWLLASEMKLMRIRITNLDPKKKDLPGEIFTVANEHMGTVRKYVPFGEVTDNGYHVPHCIYKELESRKFLNIRTVKDARTGRIKVESGWAKEFSIEVLPMLTSEELARLAMTQTASGSVTD
jgi:hypothetical protein